MFWEEESLCFLACQQIDIPEDGTGSALRLEVFQNLSILQGNGCGYAFYLFHIYITVALCYDLCCGIFDTIDIYGQYAHRACGNVEFWQFNSTNFEPDASFRGYVLQAFVVVDEYERAISL